MKNSMTIIVVLMVILLCSLSGIRAKQMPIVLWHGMGDSCCKDGSLHKIITHLNEQLPTAYIRSLMIGENERKDLTNSYFMNSNHQIEFACKLITSDANLTDGFHLLGFSQGSQFSRALVQRCLNATVVNLITFGGQHQGVYGFPRCPGDDVVICNLIRKLLSYGAYETYVQEYLVQAQYWHSPIEENVYRERSIFLADINNERKPLNEQYKQRLQTLNKFIMIQFDNDTMVQPKESSLFGFYKPGQSEEVLPLQQTALYADDRLGLKKLDEENRLTFIRVPGDHLQFTLQWFTTEIIDKYLR